jgi:uncharacterized membrane protein YdfJ with MMPL/SSD domain
VIRKQVIGPRSIHWHRTLSVLVIAALLIPLVVMAPAWDAHVEQAGEPSDTPEMVSAYALAVVLDRLRNQASYSRGLVASVNWD